MAPYVRLMLAALVSSVLLAGNTITASADVISNVRVTLGPFAIDNPCDPSEGPIVITVVSHQLVRVQSDGTIIVHVNAHGTGVSATGTEYVINRTFSLVNLPGPGGVTIEIFIRRISKGPVDNALIAVTISDTVVTDTKCVG